MENDQNGVMPTPVQADNSVSAPEGEPLQTTRERVADAIAEAIGLDAYDCTRTWAAWSVGTMSQDDFVEVVRDQDRINEIADAAIAVMQQSTQASLKSGATQAETPDNRLNCQLVSFMKGSEVFLSRAQQAIDAAKSSDHKLAVLANYGDLALMRLVHGLAILRQIEERGTRDEVDAAKSEGQHDTLKKQIEDGKKIVKDCQSLLASYLPPGSGISPQQCISDLLGILDGPRARSFLEGKQSSVSCHLPDSADRSVSPSALQTGDVCGERK